MADKKMILDVLRENLYTAAQLGSILNCSEKSVRTAISELRETMKDSGAEITSVKGKGYRLSVYDEQAFAEWRKNRHRKKTRLPETNDERVLFILRALLFAEEPIRRKEIADELYVTEKTVTSDLKKVSLILKPYHLTILHIPAHGLYISGSEFSMRQCMLNCAISPLDEKDAQVKEAVDRITANAIRENGLSVPEYLLESLRDYLALSANRMQRNHFINDAETEEWPRNVGVFYMAGLLISALVQEGLIKEYTESEIYYVSLYLWGNRFMNEYTGQIRNYVIPRHTRRWVSEMSQLLEEKYKCSLKNDEAFQKCLLNHTIAVEIRLKYNIQIVNPDTAQIRGLYPYAWKAAKEVIAIMEEQLGISASDDEIGFYTMLLESVLPKDSFKLNVLYCGNPELIEDYVLRESLMADLSDYIELVDQSEHPDLIITTKPLKQKYEIPVIEINYHLYLSDRQRAKENIIFLYHQKMKDAVN